MKTSTSRVEKQFIMEKKPRTSIHVFVVKMDFRFFYWFIDGQVTTTPHPTLGVDTSYTCQPKNTYLDADRSFVNQLSQITIITFLIHWGCSRSSCDKCSEIWMMILSLEKPVSLVWNIFAAFSWWHESLTRWCESETKNHVL